MSELYLITPKYLMPYLSYIQKYKRLFLTATTKAKDYFGSTYSLSGETADIDCWLDAAGAESILDELEQAIRTAGDVECVGNVVIKF